MSNSTKMLVTIIVNNFNYARYLRQAIISALSQTYEHVEVIAVDDGSTDESRTIIEGFGKALKAIFKTNGGQASAFNAGFAVSRGEIILFLDSDDSLDPEAAGVIVSEWKKDLSKLHFPLTVIDENGVSTGQLFPNGPLPSGDLSQEVLRRGRYVSSPTTGNAFSRRLLTQIMPIPETEWSVCADSYLFSLAPFDGNIGVVDRPLGQYRVHGSSLTAIAASGTLRTDRLEKYLLAEIRQQKLLTEVCNKRGLSMNPSAFMDNYGHYKVRLASLKTDPRNHPYKADRPVQLAIRLLNKVWLSTDTRLLTKLAFTGWTTALLTLPRALIKPLIVVAFSGGSKSALRSFITKRT